MIYGLLYYLVEYDTDDFEKYSILETWYWATMTLANVGYGDSVPKIWLWSFVGMRMCSKWSIVENINVAEVSDNVYRSIRNC